MTTYLAIENAKALISLYVECQLLWHLTMEQCLQRVLTAPLPLISE